MNKELFIVIFRITEYNLLTVFESVLFLLGIGVDLFIDVLIGCTKWNVR